MYPTPAATGQWTPNGAPPTTQPQQHSPYPPPAQQPQPQNPYPPPQAQHWSPQPQHQQQPNGNYTQRAHNPNQIPPISQAIPQGPPAMTTLQPSHPDQYRSLPAPPQMYAGPYVQQPPMPYPPQPAPRQRTAIACRYCRRRKIRCSGFDQSEDGRCTNCQRFSQECVFTPVSAQTQAFVPAAALNRYQGVQGGPPPQLYGAYGQPLPQAHQLREPYPPPPGQQPQQHPYPNGAYQNQQPVYQQQPPAGQAPQMQPQQQPQQQQTPQPPQQQQSDQTQQNSTPQSTAGQKRPTDEPHTPTLPPPNPANSAQLPHRGSSDNANAVQYTYPDPTGLTPAAASPASSTTSYISAQPTAQPYYAQAAPPRRTSPQSSYSYDQSRTSASPHNLGNSTPIYQPQPNTSDPSLRPPQPPVRAGTTPPPNSAQRQGVKINELVGPSGQQNDQQQQNENERARSAADSSMLNQLDRRM